jgi:hypothetical protein
VPAPRCDYRAACRGRSEQVVAKLGIAVEEADERILARLLADAQESWHLGLLGKQRSCWHTVGFASRKAAIHPIAITVTK